MEDTTMKKTYITPELEVVKIAVAQMLAASKVGFGDPVDNAGGAESPSMDDDMDW